MLPAGLYLGAFGPHGPELLQLSRVMMDGEEWVHATKVTGALGWGRAARIGPGCSAALRSCD
jgi:hypothetical protein